MGHGSAKAGCHPSNHHFPAAVTQIVRDSGRNPLAPDAPKPAGHAIANPMGLPRQMRWVQRIVMLTAAAMLIWRGVLARSGDSCCD